MGRSASFHWVWVGLELLGGAITQVFPDHQWIGFAVMGLGALMVVYGAGLWIFRALAGRGCLRRRISLQDASIRLYEATQNDSLHSLFAEKYKDVEGWYASEIVRGPDDEYDIPIFGRKPPSRKRVQIPVEHLKNGVVGRPVNTYVSRDGDFPGYVDLEVTKRGFRKRKKQTRKHFMGKQNGNR